MDLGDGGEAPSAPVGEEAGRSFRGGAGANYLGDAGGDALPLLESILFCDTKTSSFFSSSPMQM
jgi:hypothetical protein